MISRDSRDSVIYVKTENWLKNTPYPPPPITLIHFNLIQTSRKHLFEPLSFSSFDWAMINDVVAHERKLVISSSSSSSFREFLYGQKNSSSISSSSNFLFLRRKLNFDCSWFMVVSLAFLCRLTPYVDPPYADLRIYAVYIRYDVKTGGLCRRQFLA